MHCLMSHNGSFALDPSLHCSLSRGQTQMHTGSASWSAAGMCALAAHMPANKSRKTAHLPASCLLQVAAQCSQLWLRDQAHCPAQPPVAPCPADAVHVCGCIARQIQVDHQIDVLCILAWLSLSSMQVFPPYPGSRSFSAAVHTCSLREITFRASFAEAHSRGHAQR